MDRYEQEALCYSFIKEFNNDFIEKLGRKDAFGLKNAMQGLVAEDNCSRVVFVIIGKNLDDKIRIVKNDTLDIYRPGVPDGENVSKLAEYLEASIEERKKLVERLRSARLIAPDFQDYM
jgi:hypothetical protein